MLVFDKLCERKSERQEYFYNQVTYDYELLEDYQDIYSDFHKSDFRPRRLENEPEETSDIPNYGPMEETPPYHWGPERYKYSNHPLYLMVSV